MGNSKSSSCKRAGEAKDKHKELEQDTNLEHSLNDSDSSESEGEYLDDSSQDEAFTTPPVSYNLKLFCSTDQTKSRNTKIVIPHTPRTVLDVKLCVEKDLSIPACCQSVIFESHELRDQDSIKEQRIREGDTLVIKYTSDAMVEDVREIIQEMKAMRRFLQRKDIRKSLANGYEQGGEFSNVIKGQTVERLISAYFHPSDNERSKTNFLFFVSNNGLRVINELHQELLKYPWEKCPPEIYYLEYTILRVLWHTTTHLSIRKFFFQQSTLEAVMKSLVRIEIPADSDIQGPRKTLLSQRLMSETLFQAVGTVGNLSEIPECRAAIASRKNVLDQLLATLTCPSYNYIASIVAAAALLCLSYSHETHPYLITDNVIDKFEKACSTSKRHTLDDEQQLKYLQSVFYAQLLHSSAAKIPSHMKHKMYKTIRNLLATATYLQIHIQEKKYGYFWSTIIPILKLAYFPQQSPQWSFCGPEENPNNETEFLQELEGLCIEAGVFSLQIILLSEKNRNVLITESLVDYVTCLPWHLSPDTKAHRRACELRLSLSQKMQLQPPSLVNLTKAKLAATHCGLEKVLKANSLHDITDNMGV